MPLTDFGYPETLAPVMESLSIEIAELMADLEAGKVDVDDWRDEFASLLAKSEINAFLAAGRPRTAVTGDASVWLAIWLATQLDHLNGFANTIKTNYAAGGQYSPAWNSRAQLYSGSVVTPYWWAETEGLPLPALPGDGSSECGQADACGWSILWHGDHALGNADAYWILNKKRHARVHCQQCLERAEKWSPLRIRNWELELPDYIVKERRVKHWGTNWKGGRGSGNFNHAGIPGFRGGSAPGGGRSMGNIAPPPTPIAPAPAAAPAGPVSLERAMRTGALKIDDDPNRPRGGFDSARVAIDGDGFGIAKPSGISKGSQQTAHYQSEVAAYEVANRLGMDMVPLTVKRYMPEFKANVSVQHFVKGASDGANLKPGQKIRGMKDVGNMTLLDIVIANVDRKPANFLVKNNGELVAIDHGMSLSQRRTMKHDHKWMCDFIHQKALGLSKMAADYKLGRRLPVSRSIRQNLEDSIKDGSLRALIVKSGRPDLVADRTVERAQYLLDNFDTYFYHTKVATKGVRTKGGPGSGNFNHAGIPGHQGGSSPVGSGPGEPARNRESMASHYTVQAQDKELANQIQTVISAIDGIHKDGRLSDIPIEQANLSGDAMGGFVMEQRRAAKIMIKPGDNEVHSNIAHEIGHQVDLEGFSYGNALSDGCFRAASYRANQTAEVQAAMAAVGKAVERSKTIKGIKKIKKEGQFTAGGQVVKANDGFINYLMQPKEVWARAYSQYITTKAGAGSPLHKELSGLISAQKANGGVPRYWDHDDFKPIMAAMDELFGAIGWRK